MSEERDPLIKEFLAFCAKQRLELTADASERTKKRFRLDSIELSKKLYTKAAELERLGDITRGKINGPQCTCILYFI